MTMNHDTRASSETLVRRATELVPLLRSHALETEQMGRLHDENVEALRLAGLFDLYKPRRFGGSQASLRTSVEVLSQLARGCAATAWVTAQINGSMLMACMFPERARHELLGPPDIRLSASARILGAAERVRGGYVLHGVWPFCSGSRHSMWTLVAAPVTDEGEAGAAALFAVPTSELEIQDDWHASGLAGTCSNSVAARGVFVPEHRMAWFNAVFGGESVPHGLEGAPYRSPMLQSFMVHSASCALGIARAALDDFKAALPGRAISLLSYARKADAPVTHLHIAEAAMKIHAADLTLHRALDELETCASRGGGMETEARMRLRAEVAYVFHLCREAVDILFGASGGSSLVLSQPIQRHARDARALTLHAWFHLQTNLEAYGRTMVGLEPNVCFI
jgi:alkylation response protein AidB-like acyl-CoA dehydrogenase